MGRVRGAAGQVAGDLPETHSARCYTKPAATPRWPRRIGGESGRGTAQSVGGVAWQGKASLAQARSDLARYAQLHAQKSIAEQTCVDQQFTVRQDEAAVKADRANIAQYDLDLAYCHITAPVAAATAQATRLSTQQSVLGVQQQRLVDTVSLIGDLGGGWSASELADQPKSPVPR